jgi:glutamate formiminotransferase
VKILGGNPTEAEAKQASKAARIRKLAEEKPEMTRAEIAREVECNRSQVTSALQKPVKLKNATHKTPVIGLAADPSLTARNIVAKMGAEYAERLKEDPPACRVFDT